MNAVLEGDAMRRIMLTALVATTVLTGCETMNNTEKGALVGTGMGAIAGTALGAATGNPRTGAALGALGGAVVGSAVGNAEDKRETKDAIRQASHDAAVTANRLGLTDVVQLSQQGTDPDVIINQIRSTGSTFNLSTADIQYLTQQQVPGKVISAMQTSPGRVVMPRERVIVQETPVIVERPWPYYHPCYGPWHCGPRIGFTYVRR
jgi:uncharacterized protein YcfJ